MAGRIAGSRAGAAQPRCWRPGRCLSLGARLGARLPIGLAVEPRAAGAERGRHRLLGEPPNGTLLTHAAISTERALTGLVIGGGIGFVLGILAGISRPAETLFDCSMQMLRNVPHLAIIPLVILWFGIGEAAKIFLVAIGIALPALSQHLPRHPHRRSPG